MWDLPRPGLEPVSPALAGRFSTTAPPGKLFSALLRYWSIIYGFLCYVEKLAVILTIPSSNAIYLYFSLASLKIFSSSLVCSSYIMIYISMFFFLFLLHVVCHAFWIYGLMLFISFENSQPLSFQVLLLHHFLSISIWDTSLHFYNFLPFIPFVSYALFHILKLSLCQPGRFLWIHLPVQKLTSVTDFFIISNSGG